MRFVLVIVAIIGLYIWAQPPILVVSNLPPFPSGVEIVAKQGVSPFDQSIVRRAVCLTARVLEEKYCLSLGHDVKIILVPDRMSYLSTLREEESMDHDLSLFQATNSFGTSSNNHIVINVGSIPGYNDTLFITAHEFTHQYQIAEAGSWERLNWLMEGMADMVAAEVVNENKIHGEGEDNPYRFIWLTTLRDTRDIPKLKKLDTRTDWMLAMKGNGPVTYRTADVAVLNLAASKGTDSFKTYMNEVQKGVDAEQAFQEAFGLSFFTYTREYEEWLMKNL